MESIVNFNGRSDSTFENHLHAAPRSLCYALNNNNSYNLLNSSSLSSFVSCSSDASSCNVENENVNSEKENEMASETSFAISSSSSIHSMTMADSTCKKVALQELNFDVLDEILTFLPAKSLASLSATSTLMKFLVNTKVASFLELNYVERTLRSLYPKSMFVNDLHFLSFVENGFCSPTISCGFKHSAIVSKLGRVYTWGSNLDGELGHGDFRSRKVPTRIDCISNASSVSCGRAHTNVLTKDGRVYCFGENRSTPALIEGELSGKIVTDVSSGNNMSAFVTSDGELYVSGHGIVLETPALETDNDVIIDGSDEIEQVTTSVSDLYSPRKVNFGELLSSSDEGFKDGSNDSCRKFRIIQIAAGGRHLVILTNKGEVYTCGFGGMGQLGHDNTDDQPTPKRVSGLVGKTIVYVAAGQYHTIAVSSTGEMFAFGYNVDNCLGLTRQNHDEAQQVDNQEELEIVTTPRLVEISEPVVMVAAGNSQTLVLTSSNEIITFGKATASTQIPNMCGSSLFPTTRNQASNSNENPFRGVKEKLKKRARFVQIAAGGEHSCVLTDQGDIILSNRNILERASLLSQPRRTSHIDEKQLNKLSMDRDPSPNSTIASSSSCSSSLSGNGVAKVSKKRLALTPITSLHPSIGLSLMNNQQAHKRAKHVHAL